MRALVIGGTGFLGGRIARMLLDRGDEVTVIGRRKRAAGETETSSISVDITDGDALRRTFEALSVDVVFHVAAKTGVWGPRAEYHRANVEGTRNVLRACRGRGISRLVYTSTPSVVFGRDDLCGVDESQPYPDRYLCAYAETKAEAERTVLDANGRTLATVALRPHLIWGPGDPHLIERIVQRARTGRLVRVGDGRNRVDVTYIDNAAQAHLDAADRLSVGVEWSGRAFFISNDEPVELWPWLEKLLKTLGLPPIRRQISFQTAYRLGTLLEAVYGLAGVRAEPRMTRFIALQLAKSHYFDTSAARRAFGYVPRMSLAEGLEMLSAEYRGPKLSSVNVQ